MFNDAFDLLGASFSADISVALIVLNQPLDHQYPHLIQLWNRAVIRAATDGACNHLHEIMTNKANSK